MKCIEVELLKEKEKLEKELIKAKQRVKDAPEGRIYINKKDSYVEYYFKKAAKKDKHDEEEGKHINGPNPKNGKYIRKENLYIAKQIAQRDYDLSLIKNTEERIRAIDVFLKKYKKTNISEIYDKINEYRRILLEEAILSDEEYVRMWESVEYTGKSFADGTKEIYTNKGERVRSKSEKIIADRLEMLDELINHILCCTKHVSLVK